MITHNLNDIYSKIAQKTGGSSLEIKRLIEELFKVLKEDMNNYPDTPAFLLNKLGNFEIKEHSLERMLNSRIMNDEQREKWVKILSKVQHYYKTKKLEFKNVK